VDAEAKPSAVEMRPKCALDFCVPPTLSNHPLAGVGGRRRRHVPRYSHGRHSDEKVGRTAGRLILYARQPGL
jgi:hypothetical protein